ncbi:hypothetical protein VMCG_04034 [Cytospora schulzeri]|uniref:Uncharacterized protein n=1 Tax=Cytospora schulzeri TaxID=448051 RepID=A0A423WTL7_9PEZI|nr:hypothetical protein VMCG_04034 [Valsa malicola]
MKFSANALTTLAVLSGSKVAHAVCTGYNLAVGTADNLTTGYTQYEIYDTSCNVVQDLQIATSTGACDSRYFQCTSGTKTIGGYDDPTTGQSYICTADTTSEACGTDTVSFCPELIDHGEVENVLDQAPGDDRPPVWCQLVLTLWEEGV